MKIVVGLGNPGPKYETTRHNIGFLAVDRMIDRWNARGPVVKNQGEVFEATVGGEKVLLVKPLTYMNLSGRCVAPLATFYKCEPGDIVVLHDDLDLMPAQIRFKTGGGTGGHNGLKSMDECLGSGRTGYHRVRLGIGHPRTLQLKIAPVDFVLQPFSNAELREWDSVLDDVAQATELILAGKMIQAQNRFHKGASGGSTGASGASGSGGGA